MERRVLLPGTARLPVAAAPDLRGRSYHIQAELGLPLDDAEGVLPAWGDARVDLRSGDPVIGGGSIEHLARGRLSSSRAKGKTADYF